MKKHILLALSILASSHAMADKTFTLPEDTTKVIDIEEVVIIASPKETGKLRQSPTSEVPSSKVAFLLQLPQYAHQGGLLY